MYWRSRSCSHRHQNIEGDAKEYKSDLFECGRQLSRYPVLYAGPMEYHTAFYESYATGRNGISFSMSYSFKKNVYYINSDIIF